MWSRRTAWWTLAGALATFAILAWDEVGRGPIYQMDLRIDAWMTAARAAPLHAVGNVASVPGSARFVAFLVAMATAALAARRQWDLAAWVLLAAGASAALVLMLKPAFARPLPPYIHDRYHGFAFPSGHTMGAATDAIALLLLAAGLLRASPPAVRRRWWRRTGAAALTLPLVVGAGRILSQTHWAGDVLAAWALGLALLCATLLAADALPAGPI